MITKWLTSMELFAPLTIPALDIIQPQRICEIGAAEGGHTRLLYQYLKLRQGRLLTIDPFPRGTFLQWVSECSDVITHLADFSLNAIPKVESADAWFVDGDHNWYTVFHELFLIDRVAKASNKPAVIFLHDVSWPCARRDMYYNPEVLPREHVHPHSSELGIIPGQSESIKGGFRGPKWALHEGGPRNGVLTAVEDFVQFSKMRYHWIHVPAILGLGVLVDKEHAHAEKIMQHFAPYHDHPLLKLMEQDRVAHYIGQVLLNDKLASLAATS